MKVVLDGSLMTDRNTVHDLLLEKLPLPAYYGRNLDALYDFLTACPDPLEIEVTNTSAMMELLGDYAQALLDTLRDACAENPKVSMTIDDFLIKSKIST